MYYSKTFVHQAIARGFANQFILFYIVLHCFTLFYIVPLQYTLVQCWRPLGLSAHITIIYEYTQQQFNKQKWKR